MFSRHHRKVRLFFALADILLCALAFESAYWARSQLRLPNTFELSPPIQALVLGFSVTLLVVTALWFRVYEHVETAGLAVLLRETTRQTAITMVAVVLFQYLLRLDLSRPFIALFGVLLWTSLCLFRMNAGALVRFARRGEPQHLLIVGTGEGAMRLARTIEESAGYGLRLTGFIADSPSAPAIESTYPVHALSELPRILERSIVDEIIFAVDSQRLAELEDVFLMCDEDGVRTRVVCDFFPHINSQVYLDRLGHSPLLTFSAAPHDDLRLLVKRVTDVAIASAALLLLAPVMMLVAMLVRVTSPGPAIFSQVRCGLNGRRFVFYKFRSMCDNAEEMKQALEHLNERDTAFKIRNDPRLTPVGRWLRKFSLDELPQLWNVLRGDMSIVGPRPPVPEEVGRYERWQRRRLRMRPGLTCLWAISGRDAVDFETWMRLDMQYIDNWSLALDWKIMLRTVPRVLTGKGAS